MMLVSTLFALQSAKGVSGGEPRHQAVRRRNRPGRRQARSLCGFLAAFGSKHHIGSLGGGRGCRRTGASVVSVALQTGLGSQPRDACTPEF